MAARRRWKSATTRTSLGGAATIRFLCVVAGTRLALHMEWRQGNTVSATGWQEAMEKVWSHPDVRVLLKLNRGDIGFAQEKIMAWHEGAGKARPHFLFKLRLGKNVKWALARIP